MNTRSIFASCFVLVAAAMAAQPAAASVVIDNSVLTVSTDFNDILPTNSVLLNLNPYYTSSSNPGVVSPGTITIGGTTIDFDSGAYLAKGNTGGVAAAPYTGLTGTRDPNAYLSAEPNANITLNFSRQQDDLGLLWGSVDAYNTLTFYNGSNVVETLTGSDVLSNPNGYQGFSGSTYVNTQFKNGVTFDKVVLSSTSPAFELDYVSSVDATITPVVPTVPLTTGTPPIPEPGTWFLMLFGFGVVGFALRSRKWTVAAA